MNIKKKRLIGPLVCMLALSAVLIPRISAMASTGSSASLISGKQIAMDVTYGYGNNAKGGRYIPVEISLENSSEQDFQMMITNTCKTNIQIGQLDVNVRPKLKRKYLNVFALSSWKF